MSSLTVNVNDQSYTGHQIRPTVKDSNNNTQITAKLGTVNIDLGQFTISYPDSKDANGKEVNVALISHLSMMEKLILLQAQHSTILILIRLHIKLLN